MPYAVPAYDEGQTTHPERLLTPNLAERLKTETRTLHTAAERSIFMPAYCALPRNLHSFYDALEPAIERYAAHPLTAAVHAPGLVRTAALARDLASAGSPSSTSATQPKRVS